MGERTQLKELAERAKEIGDNISSLIDDINRLANEYDSNFYPDYHDRTKAEEIIDYLGDISGGLEDIMYDYVNDTFEKALEASKDLEDD